MEPSVNITSQKIRMLRLTTWGLMLIKLLLVGFFYLILASDIRDLISEPSLKRSLPYLLGIAYLIFFFWMAFSIVGPPAQNIKYNAAKIKRDLLLMLVLFPLCLTIYFLMMIYQMRDMD